MSHGIVCRTVDAIISIPPGGSMDDHNIYYSGNINIK